MNAQFFGGIYGNAEPVVIKHLIQTYPCLNAADTNSLACFGVFQRKQIQARLWRTTLIERLLSVSDLALQKAPICGQCRQSLTGLLGHSVEIFKVGFL